MKHAPKKIALKKASAGETIAGLKIVRAEECRAQTAVVPGTRILGHNSLPARKRLTADHAQIAGKLRSSF